MTTTTPSSPLFKLTTRDLVPILATRMVRAREVPNTNSVQRLVTAETGIRPSTTTVHDELTKWFDKVFWPTVEVLYPPPALDLESTTQAIVDKSIQEAINALQDGGFRQLVVAALQIGAARFEAARRDIEAALQAALDSRTELATLLTAAQERLETSHAEVTTLTAQGEELRVAAAAAATTIVTLESNIVTLEEAAGAAKAAWTSEEARLKQVAGDNQARYVAELHQLQVDIDGARQDARRSAERADAERGRAEASQTRNESLVSELAETRAKLGVAEARVAALRVQKRSSPAARVPRPRFRIRESDPSDT